MSGAIEFCRVTTGEREKGREKERLLLLVSSNPPPLSPSALTPLLVDAVTLGHRRRLQLQSDAAAAALVRRSCCFCSSTPSPLLVNAVALTHQRCLQLPVS